MAFRCYKGGFPKKCVLSMDKFRASGCVCVCVGGGVKVNFLAHFGQKSDLSGLCGIGYWVWIISTAHCKQPILVGY